MSSNGWKEVKMGDVISFNPRESIGKKQMAKKIAMENLKPFTKFIDQYELAPFNGGAKFRNGDTLLARITPCLENGKTSQVTILDNDEIGFGSTEFIVFRAEAGITDKDYIYYLSISPSLREIAIKSMIGSSGRQRVQQRVLKDINLSLPPLSEQKAIAATLSCLDDMIELNNRTNQVLEEMAQAIFKRWFVDFEFPNEDGEPYKSSGGEMVDSQLGEIPRGWRIGRFNDLIEKTISGDWGKEDKKGNYTQKVLCIRGADIPEIEKGNKGNAPYRFILPKNFETKELSANEMIVEISGGSPTQSTGRCALISNELIDAYDVPMVCTNFCRAVRFKTTNYSHFGYRYWKYLYNQDVFFQYENGTTGIKNLDLTGILDKELINLPSIELLVDFKKMSEVCIKSICQNASESSNLSKIRDNLLPKLMSGEIRVPIEEVV